jgi:quercetin dioxygenase-like cupin family protein
MDLLPTSDIAWTPAPEENFTGRVFFGPMSNQGPVNMLGVQFEPGARTDWHSHPEGQVLYVVSGAGRVQEDDGTTVDVSAGDVVYTEPGTVHWHGATRHSPMLHLSITTGGATEWLPRKVTDAEYGT